MPGAKPPYDPVSRAALEAVRAAAPAAPYADIGRAVNRIKGRRTTSRRSNVFWGQRTAYYLRSMGLVEVFQVWEHGTDKGWMDRWRLTEEGRRVMTLFPSS